MKDRRVFRTLTVYVAGAFGLMELIDIISGPLNFPGWVLTAVILLAAIGFPVAMILSWIFYLTPEGIKLYKSQLHIPFPGDGQDAIAGQPGPYTTDRFNGATDLDGLVVFQSDSPYSEAPGKTDQRIGRIYGLGSFTVIGVVVVFFLFYSGKSAHFKQRDWVVIADFVNHTEESIFDQSLTTAFEISIDQSRHINVIPRRRIQESLKRIGIVENTIVDEHLCREIAMREGASVYIVPEISKVGSNYILTGKLLETLSGTVFRSEVLFVDDQNAIIESLDRLCKKMRHHLGESRYRISGQSKPLAKVTTSSLDALKQYSLAIEHHLKMEFEMAVTHYENAIRIDSNFTAAKASLGNILYERYDREKGKQWLDEAIQHIANLTEREKNGIFAFYAANIENDLPKAVKYTRMNIELYPDDAVYRNNLGWYFQNMELYDKAIEQYKRAIRLDPYSMIPYGGLIWIYMEKVGEMDSSMVWSKRMISIEPENPWGYFYQGSAYVGINDLQNAKASYLKARDLNPGLLLNQYRLAHTCRLLGMLDEAIEVLQEILRINPQEASAHYDLGVYHQLNGDNIQAQEHFLKFRSIAESWEDTYPDLPETYIVLGVVLTRLGDHQAGMEAGKKAMEMDSTAHLRFAELLTVQEKTEEALNQLERALENGYRDLAWIKLNPDLFPLQTEERFTRLLDRYFK